MGMALTFFIITESAFLKLQNQILNYKQYDLNAVAQSSMFIEESFSGVEFLLKKGLGLEFEKLFNPDNNICSRDLKSPEFLSLSDYERIEILSTTPQESYITFEAIIELSNLLNSVELDYFESIYNSSELNENRIYPEVWHDDNSEDKVYNLRDIKKQIVRLKDFLNEAKSINRSCIFVHID